MFMVPTSGISADHTKDKACINCCHADKDPKLCDNCCKDKGKDCMKDCCKKKEK